MECNSICTHASASGICVSFQSIRDSRKVQKCVGDLSDQIKANNTATKMRVFVASYNRLHISFFFTLSERNVQFANFSEFAINGRTAAGHLV